MCGMSPQLRAVSFAAALIVAACDRPPVEWDDVRYEPPPAPARIRGAALGIPVPAIPGTVSPCLRSVTLAAAEKSLARAWWVARADSSVVLAVQLSTDGLSWSPGLVVDARDRGGRGCARPDASVFLDPRSSYLHLAYFIEPADGAGVFFSHSMDGGAMFHEPVPVVYGATPSAASVAGRGDNVAIAHEDPNSTRRELSLALSRTAGHIFEQRLDVNPEGIEGIRPLVSIDGDRVTVRWRPPSSLGDSVTAVRAGRWRR